MAVEVDKIIRMGIAKLIKAEWLTAYIVARHKAFSMNNILSRWRAAGLLRFNPAKVIDRCPVNVVNTKQIQPQSPIITSALEQCILNSSPSDAIALHEGNTALLDMLDANQALNSLAKRWIKHLTKSAERLFAQTTLLEREKKDAQKTLGTQKRQTSSKRRIIKGHHFMTRPEILNPLLEEEARIATKKRKVERKKNGVATAVEENDDTESEASIQDCIVVGVEPDES